MKRALIFIFILFMITGAAYAQAPQLPGQTPVLGGSDDPADVRDFKQFKGRECAPYCSEFRIGYRWAEKEDIRDLESCQRKALTFRRGCEARVDDVTPTFHGYKCPETCDELVAGYEWAKKSQLTSPEQCAGDAIYFTNGCLAWITEFGAAQHRTTPQ